MTYRNTEEALRARVENLEEQLRESDRRLADVMGRGDNTVETKLRAQLREQAETMQEQRMEIVRSRWKARSESAREIILRGVALGIGGGLVGLTVWLLVISADACASPLHAGYVVGRYHHPEYITTTTVCTGSKNQTCVPVVTHHPERWTVRVAFDAESREVDLEHRAWDDVAMGSWFCVPNEECLPAPGAHAAEEE